MSKDVILTPEQIAAEERRWLFDAPIAELAEVKGVTVDEAVKLRTDAILQEAAVPIEVTVRPIEPQGKLIGFASVNIGGVVVDDFKVVDGKNGVFLGAPSKPDPTSRSGYRATVRINDRGTQERLNAAAQAGLQHGGGETAGPGRGGAPRPIREQMDKAGKEAAQKNAARSAPAKGKEGGMTMMATLGQNVPKLQTSCGRRSSGPSSPTALYCSSRSAPMTRCWARPTSPCSAMSGYGTRAAVRVFSTPAALR